MKIMRFLGVCFLVLFLFSCGKDNDLNPLKWTCGENSPVVVKEFSSKNSTELHFSFESENLCLTKEILLLVEEEEAIVFRDTIAEFPATLSVSISANAAIKVTTSMIDNGLLALCPEIGEVAITLSY